MKQTPQNNTEQDLLPEDTTQALKVLINFSEKLLALCEQETQALVQGDMVTFSIIQDEKDSVSRRYAKASEEFRARLEEFRSADRTLLDQLESLQKQLGDKAKSNNEIVSRMFERAKEKVQKSLVTVQELAGQKPVRFQSGHNGEQQTGA